VSKELREVVPDIHSILDRGLDHTPSDELASKYASRIGEALKGATLPRNRPREKGKLWASDIGKECDRKSWYEFNMPEHGATLPGSASFKFLYGNLLEETVLYFAEESGHKVENLQHPVMIEVKSSAGNPWTVSGRIDCVLDDVMTDVKSTSSYGYAKYSKEGLNAGNDSFGYRYQVSYYFHFNNIENEKIALNTPSILWIDKQNGHLNTQPILDFIPKQDILDRIKKKVDAIEGDEPPERGYSDKPHQSSGNKQLDIACSYCDFKKVCWPDMRTFIYGHGPVFLTEVKKLPRVLEVT
jgi:hypothetical protein